MPPPEQSRVYGRDSIHLDGPVHNRVVSPSRCTWLLLVLALSPLVPRLLPSRPAFFWRFGAVDDHPVPSFMRVPAANALFASFSASLPTSVLQHVPRRVRDIFQGGQDGGSTYIEEEEGVSTNQLMPRQPTSHGHSTLPFPSCSRNTLRFVLFGGEEGLQEPRGWSVGLQNSRTCLPHKCGSNTYCLHDSPVVGSKDDLCGWAGQKKQVIVVLLSVNSTLLGDVACAKEAVRQLNTPGRA